MDKKKNGSAPDIHKNVNIREVKADYFGKPGYFINKTARHCTSPFLVATLHSPRHRKKDLYCLSSHISDGSAFAGCFLASLASLPFL